MEDVIKLLHALPQLLDRMKKMEEELSALKAQKSGEGKFIPLTKVQEMLRDPLTGKVPSRGALRRWHVDEKLIQYGAGYKIYYLESDVLNMKRLSA